MSICQSVNLSICQFVNLPVCQSVSLSFYLSYIYISLSLCIFLFIYLLCIYFLIFSCLIPNLRYLGLVLAALALEGVVPQVGDGDEAAEVAHVNAVRVTHLTKILSNQRQAIYVGCIAIYSFRSTTQVIRGPIFAQP